MSVGYNCAHLDEGHCMECVDKSRNRLIELHESQRNLILEANEEMFNEYEQEKTSLSSQVQIISDNVAKIQIEISNKDSIISNLKFENNRSFDEIKQLKSELDTLRNGTTITKGQLYEFVDALGRMTRVIEPLTRNQSSEEYKSAFFADEYMKNYGEESGPDYPDNVWFSGGKYRTLCRSCDREFTIECALEDFDPKMAYCGGSFRCIP